MNIYIQNGFNSRKDYLQSLADDFATDIDTVLVMADVLGPDEDFDGLLNFLEDAE